MSYYSIKFNNNYGSDTSICLFQRDDSSPHFMSLAWLRQDIPANAIYSFGWNDDYCFVWSYGPVVPNVAFPVLGVQNAGIQTNNKITLAKINGSPAFINQQNGSPGSLTITQEQLMETTAVGIGIDGRPTIASWSMPYSSYVFAAQTTVWLMLSVVEQGMVLVPGTYDNALQVNFPPGVFSVTVELGPDGSLIVLP
jgi:rhizosphere induced protein